MKKKYYITHIQKRFAEIEADCEADVRHWIESASDDDYENNKWLETECDEYIETDDGDEKHFSELNFDYDSEEIDDKTQQNSDFFGIDK